MPHPSIALIILNWNGWKDTQALLGSLRPFAGKNSPLRTLVVDNGSTDGSLERLRKAYGWVEYLALDTNLGFVGGNNEGIRHVLSWNPEYIWILNNDTLVDASLNHLANAFADDTIGAISPKIYFAPGKEYHHDRYRQSDRGKVLWYAGGKIDWANMYASHRGVDEVDVGQYDEQSDTEFLTGCSLVMRASVARRVGLFDPKLYLYMEDLDFSLRMRKAGYRTVYYPKTHIWHVNAGSSGRPGNPLQRYYLTRNRLLIGMRYAPWRTRIALIRESFRFLLSGSDVERQAVRDFYLRRYGGTYEKK